jgi:lysozyme
MSKLLESVKLHEGLRLKAYQDSVGVWTIGYGENLQELEIDEALAEAWLEESLIKAEQYARNYSFYHSLSQPRKDVLIEMIFNMGPSRVRGFTNALAAMKAGRYEDAAMEMLDSKWARQVGNRAKRLAKQMETGKYWNADTG